VSLLCSLKHFHLGCGSFFATIYFTQRQTRLVSKPVPSGYQPFTTAELLQDRQFNCKRNNEALSSAHCCRRKAVITYSVCTTVALGIQHEMRMRRIILSSVACVVLPHLSTLLHIQHDFQENFTEHKLRLQHVILRTIQQGTVTNVHMSS
jgi:hypothetical protein